MTPVTYDWAYLCSNPRRLKLTLQMLPHEPFVDLKTMHVCYASHLDGDVAWVDLNRTCEDYAPRWLCWTVTDLSRLERHVPPTLMPYWKNDKKRWALGMKLFLPFAFEPPYLYTDDDVLVTNDPQPMMGNSFGSKGCFRFEDKKHAIAQQIFNAFEIVIDCGREPQAARCAYTYDEHALDAGVWFQKYPDDWAYRLIRFAGMPYLADLTTRNLELRCLDQRFLTAFGIKHGWDPVSIGNGFAPPSSIREGFFAKKTFFHYKSSSKERWMKLIEDYIGRH